MRMLRPFRRSAFLRHDRAMHAPSQTAAASSNVMPAGLCAKGALSRMHTYSACAPKPRTPKTWSPTWNSVTTAPISFTSPASSMPRILCLGRSKPVPTRLMKTSALRSPQSVRVTVVAWTLMRTSSAPGTGASTSTSRSTSGDPYRSWTTALIGSIPSPRTRKPTRRRFGTAIHEPQPRPRDARRIIPVTVGYEGAPPDPGGPVDPVVRTEPVDEVDRPAWFTLMAPGWWPPDGSVTQAYGLCFDPCGRIVLVQLDDGFWTLPGGNVEPDETPLDETTLDTLLREVAEDRP